MVVRITIVTAFALADGQAETRCETLLRDLEHDLDSARMTLKGQRAVPIYRDEAVLIPV